MSPAWKDVLAEESTFIGAPPRSAGRVRRSNESELRDPSDWAACVQQPWPILRAAQACLQSQGPRRSPWLGLLSRLSCRSSGCVKLHQVTLGPSESFVLVQGGLRRGQHARGRNDRRLSPNSTLTKLHNLRNNIFISFFRSRMFRLGGAQVPDSRFWS